MMSVMCLRISRVIVLHMASSTRGDLATSANASPVCHQVGSGSFAFTSPVPERTKEVLFFDDDDSVVLR